MNQIYAVFKGILIGIASIVPGVSGGTIAVSMGVYDKIIYAVTHLLKEWKNSLKTLLPYGIGVFLAVTFFSFAVDFFFTRYPLPTNLTFLGLILGGVPAVFRKIPSPKWKGSHLLAFLLTFLIISGLVILDAAAPESIGLSNASAGQSFQPPALFLIFTGILAAATLVIPGVSGTMLLMMLGCYQPLLSSINQFMISLLGRNMEGVFQECHILIPFGIGLVCGVILCAYLMEFLFSRFEALTHCAILGLILSSPLAILTALSLDALPLSHIAAGILLFFFGFFLASKLEEPAE